MTMKLILTLLLIISITNPSFSQKKECGWEGINNQIFSDSKGNELKIFTTQDENKKIYFDSEFFITDSDTICYFYNAIDDFRVEILKDTLNVYELHDLCIKENFECDIYDISKTSYYFNKKKLIKNKTNLIPTNFKIAPKDKIDIYNTIDNIENLHTGTPIESIQNTNKFIKKLEAFALLGDLKSFLKLIEFNQIENPDIAYSSRKSIRIILEHLYQNNKLPDKIFKFLVYGYFIKE